MSLKVAILADDLSGGNSVGAEFARRGFSTILLRGSSRALCRDECPDVLVVDTGTRNLRSDQAYSTNRRAAELIRRHEPRIVVKKIDSLLRGPMAAELDAVADAFGFERGLVIPASPKAGRTTLHGRQQVGGEPLLAALSKLDPTAQVATDEVAGILSTSRMAINQLDLETIRMGRNAISERLAEIGEGLIIVDCERQDDLCVIVGAAIESGISYFAGSYGIGEALSDALNASETRRPTIVVAGSLSEATRRQAAYLRADASCHVMAVCPEHEDGSTNPGPRLASLIAEATSALQRGQDLVLHTRSSLEAPASFLKGNECEGREREAVVEKLMVAVITPLMPLVSALVVSGGATADAILGGLNAHGFSLTEHELLPGIPLVRVYGGDWTGVPCVTKPGSFGADDALAAILGFFRTHPVSPPLSIQKGRGGL